MLDDDAARAAYARRVRWVAGVLIGVMLVLIAVGFALGLGA